MLYRLLPQEIALFIEQDRGVGKRHPTNLPPRPSITKWDGCVILSRMTTPAVAYCEAAPFGRMALLASADGLTALLFASQVELPPETVAEPGQALAAEGARQLLEYLDGGRQAFDLPIDWSAMPPAQAVVLKLVNQIPYGQVRTYGEIALALGKPGASRAVGNANARNPLPLIIPCHRVMGADGGLRGYGGPGGIPTKAWLLQFEGALLVP